MSSKISKILVIFGTRPEAIKLAPLITKIKKEKSFNIKVCLTGQHSKMLNQVIKIFKIKIDYNLKLMKKNQDFDNFFSRGLIKTSKIIKKERPDIIIVQGDTNTSLMAALAGYQNKIRIAHVEAGLRTDDLLSPWPEEGNRKMISSISDYNFAPTVQSKTNLLKEGISRKKIFVTGNTVVDSLIASKFLLEKNIVIKKNFGDKFDYLFDKKVVLVTLHRREVFGIKLIKILKTIEKLAKNFKEINFIFPVHLNPNVKKNVYKILNKYSNIYLFSPFDYLTMIYLMSRSYLIISDSGGIQEEAPSFKVPLMILRDKTERPEVIKTNQAILAGTREKEIILNFKKIINNKKFYKSMIKKFNPFGNGKASDQIISVLKKVNYKLS